MAAGESLEARLRAAPTDGREELLDDLAASAAAGDDGAAATLAWAVRHFGLARPAIRQYLFRPVDIDVAEQQTLIAVAYRISSFRSEARFTTWLHRVAANEAKQVVRSRARHEGRTAALPGDAPQERAPHRFSSWVADRAVVQREVDRLPVRLRRALVLREYEGLPYTEVALALGVPVGTAKTWTRRARLLLTQRLSDQLGPGSDAGRWTSPPTDESPSG